MQVTELSKLLEENRSTGLWIGERGRYSAYRQRALFDRKELQHFQGAM
jgi:hypothetical protein